MPVKKGLELSESRFREKNKSSVPDPCFSAAKIPDGVTDIVTNHSTKQGKKQNQDDVEISKRSKQGSGNEQSFSGHREAEVLEQKAEEYRPIAILHHIWIYGLDIRGQGSQILRKRCHITPTSIIGSSRQEKGSNMVLLKRDANTGTLMSNPRNG